MVLCSSMPVSAQDVELIDYVIQPGETCSKISQKMFGNRRAWDLIHKHNPKMGPLPHKLVPGEILKLPAAKADADAQLTYVRRNVQTREPKKPDWNRAKPGKDLYRGWRVNTLARSAADVTFRDESVVQMRANTLVIIYGGDARSARRRTSSATLERGTLRSRLGELRLQVTTPSARADLNRGSSVVSVDEAGLSRVSNHEGGAARVRASKGKAAVSVKPGFGTKVASGERKPSKPKALPESPQWSSDTVVFFSGLHHQGASIRGQWQSTEQAKNYRVEVLAGRDDGEPIAALTVPSSITKFEIHRLPQGDYFARISALDDDWFESKPSKPLHIQVALVDVQLPGQATQEVAIDSMGDSLDAPEVQKILVGTRLIAPAGFKCGLPEKERANEILLQDEGDTQIECITEDGAQAPPVKLNVVRPQISPTDGKLTNLPRGVPTTISINVNSEVPLPNDVTMQISEGITMQSARTDSGWDVTLLPALDAPKTATLQLIAGRGDEAAILETVEVDVADIAAVPQDKSPTYAPNEALGLSLSPNVLGLRNDRRQGFGAWLTVSHNGEGPSSDGYWRTSIGLEMTPIPKLRLGMAHAIDIDASGNVPIERGDRDLLAWAGYHLVTGDDLSIYVELGTWFPTSDDVPSVDIVRLVPSIEISYEVKRRLLLRTRQGGLIGMGAGDSLLWASAYGIDVRVGGPVALAAEVDLSIGELRDQTIVGIGAGGGLSVLAGPASIYAMARYGLTDDFEALVGRLTLSTGVRLLF